MKGPTLLEPLTTIGQLVRVEPEGAAAVTLIVQPLSGVSTEARAALELRPGPAAVLTWRTSSPLGHESIGAVVLQRDIGLEGSLFLSGLTHLQARACGEVLAGLITWEECP